MKKILICILIVLSMVSLVACSKKDANILVGTWVDKDGDTLTLKDNGEYESTHYYDKEGTWEAEDDILTFKTLFDKEKEINYRVEEEGENKYIVLIEEDLIFGGEKEIKFAKEKD